MRAKILGWCPCGILECPDCGSLVPCASAVVGVGTLAYCAKCKSALELLRIIGKRWLWAVVEEAKA